MSPVETTDEVDRLRRQHPIPPAALAPILYGRAHGGLTDRTRALFVASADRIVQLEEALEATRPFLHRLPSELQQQVWAAIGRKVPG